jgi:hypothetical protein
MHIIVGYCKGEAFVEGHTTSRAKADKWIETYPNGKNNEYDYVERQTSHNLSI